MSDAERSQLIDEFCKVTGTNESRARLYLIANGWDSNLAMSSYFEETDEEPESGEDPPPATAFPRPGSPKPAFPPSSRIATFASLANNAENDEEEGQAFYAGGSERSGQQVLGPGKRKAGNEVVEEVFKAVRKFSGESSDPASRKGSKTKIKVFKGTGFVLGSTPDESDRVPSGESAEAPRELNVHLRLWRSGFTVDDGPLRDYNETDSKEFLESIRKGEIPDELRRKGGEAEIHLSIEDCSHSEYVPKKQSVQAFAGTGFRLGSIAPVVASEATPGNSEKSESEAQEELKLDESKPTTTVQIRLANGSRLIMKANHTHTVGDVRRFIVVARPEYSAHVFSLMTSYPTKELTDDQATLESENLLNAVIVQKLK